MLRLNRVSGAIVDGAFRDLPSLLREGDVLVVNDSRVIPARLEARRAGLHTQKGSPEPRGRVEVLLTAALGDGRWTALVKPGRKVPAGERLLFGDADGLSAEVVEAGEFGERTLQFAAVPDFFERLARLGHIPLPPYIHRDDTAEDRERYQTVYAGAAAHGSAAAPTAGLHFTPGVLQAIRSRGVQVCSVTLHVGLGTFQPVRVEELSEIRLHAESYTLPEGTAAAINRAKLEGRRVVAAGTTTVRTLEHCGIEAMGAPLAAGSGSTSVFLSPGHRFRIVDALLTNFHLPGSTLLMLVAAFGGYVPVMEAYRHAVAERYRFFSYGDCMFLS